jgi:hypothetical protein
VAPPLTLSAHVTVPTTAKSSDIKSTAMVSGKFTGCNNATAATDYKQIANGVAVSGTASNAVPVS